MSIPDSTLNPHAPEYVPLSAQPPPNYLHLFPPPPPPSYSYQLQPPHGFYSYGWPPTTGNHMSTVRQAGWNSAGRFVGDNRGRGRGRDRRLEEERRSLGNEEVRRRDMQRDRHTVMPLKRDEEKTTVMIKNIPYDYSRKQLIALVDEFCTLENNSPRVRDDEGHPTTSVAYDYLYLPIDFKSNRSRGYAFVNFTTAAAAWRFFEAFHLKNWSLVPASNWSKKIEVVCAMIQGKEALVSHFSDSSFECATDEFLPAVFEPPRDGSGQPVRLTAVGRRRRGCSVHGESSRND